MPDLSVRVGSGRFPASRVMSPVIDLTAIPSETLHITEAVTLVWHGSGMVTFLASTSHATVIDYTARLRVYGNSTVIATENLFKPTPDGNNLITVDLSALFAYRSAGDYTVSIVARDAGGSSDSEESSPFTLPLPWWPTERVAIADVVANVRVSPLLIALGETLHTSEAVTASRSGGGAAANIFDSSFTVAEGWTADVDNTAFASPGATVGSVTNWETGTAPLDSVITAANYSGGRGGRGHRHYRSGHNTMGGGLRIVLSSPQTHIWFRYMIRYSSGFTFSGGSPTYTKDWYDDSGNGFIIGFQGGQYGYHVISGSQNYPSNIGGAPQAWSDWYPGGTSDGSWKCVEGEMNKSGGILRMWIDDVLTMDRSGTSISSASDFDYMVTNNHDLVTSSNSYTDYDDIAVSNIGRIGPL